MTTTVATKIRYDGSACLNLRSVTSACKSLASVSPAGTPMSRSELASILWFVETAVTSQRLFFDGTVPKETAERAIQDVGNLKSALDLKSFDVTPIEFKDPHDTLAAARDALAESRFLMRNFAIDSEIDSPLDTPDHENFLRQLGIARLLPEADRQSLALSWVSDAFRGSKCLAAMVANGDAALDTAIRLYEQHADRAAVVSGALINRFRLNYVNQLAAQKSSAYIPDPGFEVLTNQHHRLFKDYLLERIVGKLQTAPGEMNILVENMKAETPLPPIGLYALMATRAVRRPGAVLETAYNEFRQDDSLMQVIWKNTRGGIALKKENDDYASEIEHYFYDHFKTLEKEAQGIKVLTKTSRTARTYLIPAVLKGLLSAVPEALGVGKLWNVIYGVLRETASEASIPFLSDRLLGQGCDSYISQYKSLKWNLAEDDAVKAPLEKLSEQVERVFGRKLSSL